MAFKIICESCNNSGRLFVKEDINNAFVTAVIIDGSLTLEHGDSEGYDYIKIKCDKCGNEVVDE